MDANYRELYVASHTSTTVHLSVNGRTYEACNVDDMDEKEIVGEDHIHTYITQHKYKLCKRCFPNGSIHGLPDSVLV